MRHATAAAAHRTGARFLACVIAILGATAACARRPSPPPQPDRYPVAEPGVDCAAMRALADSAPAAALADTAYSRPQPKRMYVPSPELLRKMRGTVTYEVPVDTSGSPVLARASVSGLSDPAARRELEEMLARVSYRPAALHGCVVRGVATVTFEAR